MSDNGDLDKKDFNDLLDKFSPRKLMKKVEGSVGLTKKPRFDIDKPRYDQSYFLGRFKHFYAVTSPKNLLHTDAELDKAKEIVDKFRNGDDLSGMADDEIWQQKVLVDSAFHPDTGEKLIICGRMSAQVPVNTVITAGMMIFYKSKTIQFFLHWLNQTLNATVNYSNRSGAMPISTTQIGTAYVFATAAGVGSVFGLQHLLRVVRLSISAITFSYQFPQFRFLLWVQNALNPLIRKFVPFLAVAAANATNIPIMRFGELSKGTPVFTEDGKEIGLSKVAACQGISQVFISRISMAIPNMIFLPVVVDALEKKGAFKNFPKLKPSMYLFVCGAVLVFSTPFGCALFPQTHPIAPSRLESELQEKIKKLPGPPTTIFYNKGL